MFMAFPQAELGTVGTSIYHGILPIHTNFLFVFYVHVLLYMPISPKLLNKKEPASLQDIMCLFPTVNPYLSSAFVNKILFWGFFAFREHTGSSSGYMKTLLVARIQATCFGKQGNSQAVRKKKIHKWNSRTKESFTKASECMSAFRQSCSHLTWCPPTHTPSPIP